ncbi:phosphoribosylformylglycinamidine synthase-associated small membrane protein [Oryzibacter oryziterrae]|nr:phosphoribosylformylglycinamidine synthase-associated small membrane protein [Oryzibacter oryziterrae]
MAAPEDDTARIIRFMVIKAAVFLGIPLVCAAVAVYLTLY